MRMRPKRSVSILPGQRANSGSSTNSCQRAIASGWATSSICIGSLSGGTWRDLGEREQTISHFGDEFTHCQLGEPARRDAVQAVESTRQLSKNRGGGVRIVAEVSSEQRAFFECVGAVKGPERGFQRFDHVARASNRGRILFFKRTGGNLGYFGHERALVIKARAQQFLFRCAPERAENQRGVIAARIDRGGRAVRGSRAFACIVNGQLRVRAVRQGNGREAH